MTHHFGLHVLQAISHVLSDRGGQMGSLEWPCHADPVAEHAAMGDWLGFVAVHHQQQHSPRNKFAHKKTEPQAQLSEHHANAEPLQNFKDIISMSSIKSWISCCTKRCKCKWWIVLTNVLLEVSRLFPLSIIEQSFQERWGFPEEWNRYLMGLSIQESWNPIIKWSIPCQHDNRV